MKITEVYKAVMNALRKENFLGNFEVAILHPGMNSIKIAGTTKDVALGSEFSDKLQSAINDICFEIVSGDILDGFFTFAIKGVIEYVYEYKE